MTIVWAVPVVPYPPRDGGTIRIYQLLKGLASRHRIHLLAQTNGEAMQPADLRKLKDICESVELFQVPNPPARGSAGWWRARWRSLSGPALTYHNPALRDRLNRLCQQEKVDIVLLETLKMAGSRPAAGPLGVANSRDNVILSRQNYEPDLAHRMAEISRDAKDRALRRLSVRLLQRAEQHAARQFRFMTAVSEKDAESLRRLAPWAKVAVVPNGADPCLFVPAPHATRDWSVDVTGTMEYHPNRDSAEFFCRAIWPLVRADCPKARLRIVGNAASRHIPELAEVPGVEIREPGGDIVAELGGATILAVPLRIGSGTRIKILEALSAGKAVVSTSVGCEGLDLTPGQHLLVCDEPADFAKAVVSLLNDPQLRQRLGANGRRVVVERYTWAHSVERLEAFCELVAGDSRHD